MWIVFRHALYHIKSKLMNPLVVCLLWKIFELTSRTSAWYIKCSQRCFKSKCWFQWLNSDPLPICHPQVLVSLLEDYLRLPPALYNHQPPVHLFLTSIDIRTLASSTMAYQVASHPGAVLAQCRLTTVVKYELVLPTWQGRWQFCSKIG